MPRQKISVERQNVLERLKGFHGRSFFTTSETAALLSCSTKTIHNMTRDARIMPLIIGTRCFFSRDEILAFASTAGHASLDFVPTE